MQRRGIVEQGDALKPSLLTSHVILCYPMAHFFEYYTSREIHAIGTAVIIKSPFSFCEATAVSTHHTTGPSRLTGRRC
jgi:hypothetical protein